MPLSASIQRYVDSNTLTLEQANGLTPTQRYNLKSEGVRELITNGTMALEQAMGLTYQQRNNFNRVAIRALIANGTLTLDQAMGLTHDQCDNFQPGEIRTLIANGTLTLDQAKGLTGDQLDNLKREIIRTLIADGTLSMTQAMGLDLHEGYILEQDYIQKRKSLEGDKIISTLIADGILTSKQAATLTWDQRFNLESEGIHALIANGTLTPQQAIELSFEQRRNLEPEGIRGLIANGTLNIEQAMGLDLEARANLESEYIRALITDGTLTFEQAMALNQEQRYGLNTAAIYALIANGTYTIDQVLAWDFSQCNRLSSAPIRALIDNGTLTLAQAIVLRPEQGANLQSELIGDLIDTGIMTFEQAMAQDGMIGLALRMEEHRTNGGLPQRLISGELTMEAIMGGNLPFPEDMFFPGNMHHHALHHDAPVNINDSQSTHTASVHRTVSESASRVFDRYGAQLNGQNMDALISTITKWANALPAGQPMNDAAKRCVARLAAPQYTYTDPGSNINTRQMLTLSWLAIHDEDLRQGSLADAEQQFCEGLYEIQRGYNLSDTGVDLNGEDSAICTGGTFNKLVEKLEGISPDVTIEYITPTTAALKLPIVMKEEVNRYLTSRMNPKTAALFVNITTQLKQIEEQGVSVIWDAIKDRVATRMFDEFGSLYTNKDDVRFTGFIDAGQDVELGKLPSFQKKLSESEGYHQYCSATIKSYRMFSKMNRDSPESDSDDTDTPSIK